MHKTYLHNIDMAEHKDHIKDILDMLMCDIKDKNHDLYKHVKGELYEMAYGKKISEEMAKKWVENMKKVGMYWTLSETTNAMYDLGYDHDKIDFFVVANMMKNDYENLTKDDDTLALKLAHDWLDDEDAQDDKLYEYWKYIIKKDYD